MPRLAVEGVTPGYFRAMGIEVLEGRDFDERDFAPGAAEVFIVNESLARRFWPGGSAVGKRMVGGSSPPKDGRWRTVVGVVKDMRREGLDVAPILGAFVPSFLRGMDLTIRASTRVDDLIPSVRQEIRAIDSSLPIGRVATAYGRLSERLDTRRFESQALGAFSGLALLLSAAGLYALLGYQVTLRRREIGIRSALGADRRSIVRMILGKGVRLALAGAAVGVVGAAVVHPSAAELAVRDRRPQRTQLRGRRGSRAAGRGDRRVGARPPRGPRQPDDRPARRLSPDRTSGLGPRLM